MGVGAFREFSCGSRHKAVPMEGDRDDHFPSRLDKSRSADLMNGSSPPPATVPQTINFGYIQDARRRIEATRQSEIDPVEPPTLSELKQALGEEVQKCYLLARNWRNRIYRVELARGHLAVGKQIVVGTEEMLRYQYDQLQALGRLQVPGLRVPRVLGMVPEKQLYLMEFVEATPISHLVRTRTGKNDLPVACELAGKIIAQLQMARTDRTEYIPVDALARDFALAPWRLSSRQKSILEAVLQRVSELELPMGWIYGDYTADNLLFANNELFLVDPPARLRRGAQLWDFAIFRSSMRRHLWRFTLRRPVDRRRAIIRQSLAAFERSYLGRLPEPPREPALFELAAKLFELQRTAVSMTLRKGKLDLARQKLSIARDEHFADSLASRMAPLFLECEKRLLFRQLARALLL